MLKGDLPISHDCWAVVSQGFSSYAVLLKYWKVIFLLLLSLVVALSRYVDGQTPGVLRAGWYFLWWKQTALEFIVISVSWESGNAFRKPSLVWGDSCAMYLQSFFSEACFLLNKWGQQGCSPPSALGGRVLKPWSRHFCFCLDDALCFIAYDQSGNLNFISPRLWLVGPVCIPHLSMFEAAPWDPSPPVKVPQIMQSLPFKFLFFQSLFLVSSHSASLSFPSLSGGEKKASKATTADFKTWNKRGNLEQLTE